MRMQIKERIHLQLKEQLVSTVAVYVFSFFYAISTLSLPVLLSELIELVVGGNVVQGKNIIWSIVILLIGVSSLFLSNWICENAGNKFSYALREYIWGHNLYASYEEYRNRDTDADFQIVTLDGAEIGIYYFKTLPGLFMSGLISVGTLIGICNGRPLSGIILISVFVFLAVFADAILLKKIEVYERRYVEVRSGYFSYLVKVMEEIRTLKLFVLYQKVSAKIKEMGCCVTGKSLNVARVEYIQKNLLHLMQYVLLIYGLIDYARGKILLEEFLLFEQYTGILNAQMMAFITYLNNYKKKIVVEQKMESMLLAIEQYGEKEKDEIKKIVVENITFSYCEGKKIYQGFSYEFEQGKCYILKAPNGFGKTTFFELLAGIEKPSAGRILYDDTEISEMNMGKIRRTQLCFLQQDDLFYGENIQQNIDDYLDGIQVGEMGMYLNRLNIEMAEKEGDFNTILSGGQKKKLAFAIIMKKINLCKHPLILLDEPTNMLDQSTIKTVVSFVRRVKWKSIVLIISHDSQFDLIADEIVQLDRKEQNND